MMSQPKPIQLVLQGGGAKIFALIAAMDALHSAVQQGKVEITRIAGTSAGAIVGSLYAAGINPQTIRKAFESFPLDRLVRFERSWHKGAALLRLLRSIPLADDRALASMLDDLLRTEIRPGGGPIRLKDLKTPMLIVASDVSGRERIVYDSQREGQDRNLVTCILDSCAIPFFFRAAGKDSQTLILDGGLCENLASELLVSGSGLHGDVVAISFIDEAPSTPRSPLELAGALLDTAISAAVRRSKLAGNLFLIELNPFGIGTFDFAEARRALQAGRESSRYENARQKTEQMIEELCAAQGRRRVSKNRWDSADPVTMGQLLKIYRSQQLPRTFRYLLRRLTIEANSLLQEGEEDYGTRDLVVSTIQFAPSK
jgi:predicted acylesterase/phospholipase RssA